MYTIMYQEDGDIKVVSAFEGENWRPQVGATISTPLTEEEAKAELKLALLDGYRPTGYTTRDLMAKK